MAVTSNSTALILQDCTVLGASGFPFVAGDTVVMVFGDRSVSSKSHNQIARFSLLELTEISVTGPGTVTTGGGFVGGGFGVEGALEGIAIAGVLNALTTKKKIHTLVSLVTNFGELHLHYGVMDPGPLRIYLSDVFVKLRRLNSRWVQEREQLIDTHLGNGVITVEEAEILKARLASPPVWPDLKAEAEAQRLLDETSIADGPNGLCPSCDKVIPLHSETCKYCRANFGQYSSWHVIPIS